MTDLPNERPVAGKVERNAGERKRIGDIGRMMINQFYVIMKVAQLYEPNNDAFLRQRSGLMGSMKRIFELEEQAVLEMTMRSLFLNRVKILAQILHYSNLTFMLDLFEKERISAIFFSRELDEEELTEFLYLLVRREKAPTGLAALSLRLADKGINHITVTPLVERSCSIEDMQALAKRLYAESVGSLKMIMKDIRSGEAANAKRIRRLMQGLIDLMDEQEMHLVGLTTMKSLEAYTLNHSLNVCLLSLAMGRRLGLERKQIRDLGLAAIFHDLGSLLVPQEILEKPSALSDEEFRMIEEHPLHSAEMMMEMKGLGTMPVRALRATLEHHLKADLTGYPRMWKQRSPDLFAKIIEIADCFDAATTSRPYRPQPRRPEDVLREMADRSGIEFDPVILRVFINMIGIYPVGSLVALDTNELALVISTNPDASLLDRPLVKLVTDRDRQTINGETVDLSEFDPDTNQYLRTIVSTLDAHLYGIDVSRFF